MKESNISRSVRYLYYHYLKIRPKKDNILAAVMNVDSVGFERNLADDMTRIVLESLIRKHNG